MIKKPINVASDLILPFIYWGQPWSNTFQGYFPRSSAKDNQKSLLKFCLVWDLQPLFFYLFITMGFLRAKWKWFHPLFYLDIMYSTHPSTVQLDRAPPLPYMKVLIIILLFIYIYIYIYFCCVRVVEYILVVLQGLYGVFKFLRKAITLGLYLEIQLYSS